MKLYLSEQDVLACLPMSKAIELVERAFHQLADGSAINHPRRRVILPTGSVLHYMAAGTPEYFGLKAYSANPKTGAHFEVLLYRSADGTSAGHPRSQPSRADSHRRGQWRGHEISGARRCQRRGDHRQRISGRDATRSRRERPQASAKCASGAANPRSARNSPARCAEKFDLNVRATETARECVEGADIVVTATSSKEPVLESDWISPGTHINAAGSNWADRRELPARSDS